MVSELQKRSGIIDVLGGLAMAGCFLRPVPRDWSRRFSVIPLRACL